MTEKDIDIIKPLVLAHAKARATRKFHEAEAARHDRVAKEIEEQISRVLGDTNTGIIDNAVAIRRVPTEQFAVAKFRAKYPELWEQVRVPVIKDDIDKDLLFKIAPDVVAEFSTIRWFNDMPVEQG